MNTLSSSDKIDREYLSVPTDDLIRFWQSDVYVTDVVVMASTSTRRWGIKVNFLVAVNLLTFVAVVTAVTELA